MTTKFYDLVRVNTATTGTGTITLGSAVSGFRSFADASDGDTVSYAIEDGVNREVGHGVYTASGTTLTRTVLKSTNSNAAISLSGSAQVFLILAAEDLLLANLADMDFSTAPTDGQVLTYVGSESKWKGATPSSGSSSSSSSSGIGAHTFWRISGAYSTCERDGTVTGTWMNTYATSQLEMRATAGGAPQVPTAATSSALAGGSLSDLYNGSPTTSSGVYLVLTSVVASRWVAYEFAAPTIVREVASYKGNGSGSNSNAPAGWDVQYSDDGVTWLPATSFKSTISYTADTTSQWLTCPVPA